MHHRISLFPQPGDEPKARMCGTAGDIPILALDQHAELAFHDLDTAVPFLDALADEATSLAAKVRILQRQQNLLAAVEATPHDPQQAAEIRERYETETVQS